MENLQDTTISSDTERASIMSRQKQFTFCRTGRGIGKGLFDKPRNTISSLRNQLSSLQSPRPRRRHSTTRVSPLRDASQPIPLPKYHVRRTYSEVVLADELMFAEHNEIRMARRIAGGKQTHRHKDDSNNNSRICSLTDSTHSQTSVLKRSKSSRAGLCGILREASKAGFNISEHDRTAAGTSTGPSDLERDEVGKQFDSDSEEIFMLDL